MGTKFARGSEAAHLKSRVYSWGSNLNFGAASRSGRTYKAASYRILRDARKKKGT